MRAALAGFNAQNISSASKRRRINRVSGMVAGLEHALTSAPPVALPEGRDVSNQGRAACTPASSSGEISRMHGVGLTHEGQLRGLDMTLEFIEGGREARWVDFATWLAAAQMPSTPLLPLRPMLGDAQMPSTRALESLRDQLSFKALYEASASKTVVVRGGSLHTPGRQSHILMPRVQGKSWKSSS